ncbi:MAG: OmpH family outer membrane protein [Bacteroidetes bacterium]|nr:MAG: OmpH family outer membrane protein [Bacteroidota bacterium]
MRSKLFIFLLLLGIGFSGSVYGQNLKIGYANIELILLYMPETKTMNQQLQTYENKLAEDLQARETYFRTLVAEYQELAQGGADEATLAPKEEELTKLQTQLQEKQAEAQNKAMTKRQDLLAPIIEKLQKEIKALAAEEGYTYILNTVDGSGVSIVLHGPEEHDVTRKLMTRLGIQIPEEAGQ